MFVKGPPGCGKSHLAAAVRDLLASKPTYDLVVKVDFVKTVEELTTQTWKGKSLEELLLDFQLFEPSKHLARHLIKEGELSRDNEAKFIELLYKKSDKIFVVVDSLPGSFTEHLTQLLCQRYRGKEDTCSSIEELANSIIKQRELHSHRERMIHEAPKSEVELAKTLGMLVENNAGCLKKLLQGLCGNILMSRYEIPDIMCNHFVILGWFDSLGTSLLFVKHQLPSLHSIARTQPLEFYLNMHPCVKALCIIPGLAAILCQVYASNARCIKETEIFLIHRMMLGWYRVVPPSVQTCARLLVRAGDVGIGRAKSKWWSGSAEYWSGMAE